VAGVGSGEKGCRPFIGRVGRFGGEDFFLGGEVAGGSSGPAGPGRRATGRHGQGQRSSSRRRVSSILWRRGGRPVGPAGGTAGGGDVAV
jgi:hypothetical protein